MPLPRRILSVEPNCNLRTSREEMFQRAGHQVTSLPTTSDALRELSGTGYAYDVVVVCDCIPAKERSRFIANVKATSPSTPILLIGEQREPLTDDIAHDDREDLLGHLAGLIWA